MSLRQSVKDIPGTEGLSKQAIGKIAELLYQHGEKTRLRGYDEGWDVGYDEGAADATKHGQTDLGLDRIAAFHAGVKHAEGSTGNELGFQGTYRTYTDPRGLTFKLGTPVYVESRHIIVGIERLWDTKVEVLNHLGETECLPLEDIRPIGGYETPDNFLPINACVVRRNDGQLGLVCIDDDGDRYIGYGPADDCQIDTVMAGWSECRIRRDMWVKHVLRDAWYGVQLVDHANNRAMLWDDGVRYAGKRLPGDDTVALSECKLNIVTPHYVGERVFLIDRNCEGEIRRNHGSDMYQVRLLHNDQIITCWDFMLESVPYFHGQVVSAGSRFYRVDAVVKEPRDGQKQYTKLCISRVSLSQEYGLLPISSFWGGPMTVSVKNVKPMVKVEVNDGGPLIYVHPDSPQGLSHILNSGLSRWLTNHGEMQVLSMARMHVAEPAQDKENILAAIDAVKEAYINGRS